MSKIAMLVGPGYEDSEFQVPYERLREAGHEVVVLGLERGSIVAGKGGKSKVEIEHTVDEVATDAFDALVIPGGHGPDRLRTDTPIVEFVRTFHSLGRPIAAICHGPQLLIEADLVKGRQMTSWPSVRKDLENAGAEWVDRELVEDANFITARKPDDLPPFCEAILKRL